MPSLYFKGKSFVQHHHLVVPYHELTPVKSKSLTKTVSLHDNVIVHGDNLRALKALLPTHAGKVKCIYIDPPYNTGNEGWAYNDNVSSPMLQEWLGKTVDRDDLTRHDKWCCMMMPRLRLLREFLTNDGAIFVSIDDNEVHRLRCLMDEILGEDNFVASFTWQKSKKGNAKLVATIHEYVLVYARSVEFLAQRDTRWRKPKAGAEIVLDYYKQLRKKLRSDHIAIREAMMDWFRTLSSENPAKNHKHYNWSDDRGLYFPDNFHGPDDGRESRPRYDIIHPITRRPCAKPSTGWRWDEETTKAALAENPPRIHFGPDETTIPNRKTYLHEVTEEPAQTVFYRDGRAATLLVEGILGKDAAQKIPFPKDVDTLSELFALATDKDSLVMDSFAGSGTSAHAVLALNKQDGGNRRFVLVEGEDYADTITAERVRRVIKGVPSAKDDMLRKGLGGTFSYFKLGQPLSLNSILEGKDLPAWTTLASYLFFTATGEEFDPKAARQKEHYIGTSRLYDVFLLYTEDPERLKGLALTLDVANALRGPGGKQKLVFAPTKYLDEHFLDRMRITFQQLPFQIYQALDK